MKLSGLIISPEHTPEGSDGDVVVTKHYDINSITIPTVQATDDTLQVLFVDTETTGLHIEDEVVQIGMLLATINTCDGSVVEYSTYVQEQYPSCEFSPKASKINGLTREGLEGKKFDMYLIRQLFSTADVIVAHNARFDREQMQKVLDTSGQIWVCTFLDIPWLDYGCNARNLSMLCWLYGFRFDAHKADVDCLAMFYLTQCYIPDTEVRHMSQLLDMAFTSDKMLVVKPNHFNKRIIGYLKEMGFKYNGKFNFMPGGEEELYMLREEYPDEFAYIDNQGWKVGWTGRPAHLRHKKS